MKQESSRKEVVIQKLKERKCRITKQRLLLLDIILEDECSCCKEIYYKAVKTDPNIGSATVYRMINTLEEIGAINRKNMYKIACTESCAKNNTCKIRFEDDSVLEVSSKKWNTIIRKGLDACGYTTGKEIRCVMADGCQCNEVI